MSSGKELIDHFEKALRKYDDSIRPLPGIYPSGNVSSLSSQLRDSVHRVSFIKAVLSSDTSSERANPENESMFHPLKGAVHAIKMGHVEEAFWLTFLYIHFGRHSTGNWRYVREIYGRCRQGGLWDWPSVCDNPENFREWLGRHTDYIKRPGVPGGFGNHRKYVSLDAFKSVGTGEAIVTYVRWAKEFGSPQGRINETMKIVKDSPTDGFDLLYRSMHGVASFGRLGRFDYLSMIGKLGLAKIEPGSPYLSGATGPTLGAKLLFSGSKNSSVTSKSLDNLVVDLQKHLPTGPFGMQVLEDALCNWQKSPNRYERFGG